MRSVISRFLMVVFLANVLGMATLQAGPDEHDAGGGYAHDDGSDKNSSSPCEHACHVSFHFMGLPAARLPVLRAEAAAEVVSFRAAVQSASPSIPFHPPRPLA